MISIAFAGSTCAPITLTEPTFWAITGAAFVDSINPCAIAVLLILLTGLLVSKEKQVILRSGIAFIVALYLTYFFIGIGLLGAIKLTGLAPIIHKLVAIIAILVGLSNIKDFFWYGGMGFVTEIPRRWRAIMKKLLGSVATITGAFIAGVIITFFELPCTGGPYLFVLGLLSQGYSWLMVTGILLYYNLIFVLPLLVILSAVYWGYVTIDQTSSWKDKNIKVLHLVAGIIMLSLGLWLMFV